MWVYILPSEKGLHVVFKEIDGIKCLGARVAHGTELLGSQIVF